MSIYGSITNETLANVGGSWVQANRDRFAWTKFPMCKVHGLGNGHGTTTYSLPAMDNFMAKTNSLSDWAYGADRRAPRDLNKASVTVTPRVQDLQPLTRPLTSNASSEQVFADLTNNIIPGQLSMLYQGIEKNLAAQLVDGTLSTTQEFSGTGDLDSYMANADHDPLGDILEHLNTSGCRWKAEAIGGTIAMVISQRVADLFQRHPAFSGSGAASGIPQVVARAQALQHLAAVLRIDEVIELSAVADTVRTGQDSAPGFLGAEVLSFQVFDRVKMRDLAANPYDTPEGSACLFFAEDPNVTVCEDEDRKVVKFNADVEYQIGTPRGATWGIYYPTGEIFT